MKDRIFTICETLTAKGIKPTLENVRNQLGGGSFSTINPILKQWKESQNQAITPNIETPPEAIKAGEQAAALIWAIATEHQAEAINAIRTESSRIEQSAIAERDEALAEIERLEQKLTELYAANKEKNIEINKWREEAIKDVQEKNKLKKEAEIQKIKLDNVTTAAAKAEAESERLRTHAESQTAEINALKLEIEKQRLSNDNAAQKIEMLTHENEQLKADVQKASTQEKAQAKEIANLNLQTQKQQSALDSAAKALEEAKKDLTETRKELKQSQSEAAKLEGMLEAYNKKLNTK